MFKSQKIIIFSILLALVGVGVTVAVAVGISMRDSVNPDKSSAATITDLTYSGKMVCTSPNGHTYINSTMSFGVIKFANYDSKNDVMVVADNTEKLGKIDINGNYSISMPNDTSYDYISLYAKGTLITANPTNCSNPSLLLSDNGNPACLNKEPVKTANNLCGVRRYTCERNKNELSFTGFDFNITNCAEPVLDLATTAISTSTAIEKNIGETLTMYFNGEDLSSYNTINTNYYIGQQGFNNIFSTYKVYLCDNKADSTCKTEVISSNLNIPVVDVSPWSIIAKGKNIKIKVEGKLLQVAKSNQPIKIQYAQLPGSLSLLTDSNTSNNVWNGSVSILSPAPVTTTTTTTTSTSVSSATTTRSSVSSTSSRTSSTSSSRRTTSSNGTVVSESSSTESTLSEESTSSEESSFDSEYSTSSRSTSSIKPYVPVTTPPANDNTTLLLALVGLLVLFLVSLFVVYKKYKSEKESKEVFSPSPLSETPPTPAPTV